MLLNDLEVEARLLSPENLRNRLNRALEIPDTKPIPTVDDLIPNVDDKLKVVANSKLADEVLSLSLERLKANISDVKTESLARVAANVARVIDTLDVSKKAVVVNEQRLNVVVYAPQIVEEAEFEVVNAIE